MNPWPWSRLRARLGVETGSCIDVGAVPDVILALLRHKPLIRGERLGASESLLVSTYNSGPFSGDCRESPGVFAQFVRYVD